MTEAAIAPNPYSPHATADPKVRHVFAAFFSADLPPGVLAVAACDRMAVVPEEPLTDTLDCHPLPDGMCEACVTVMQGGPPPGRGESSICRECGSRTYHDAVCALCRQDLHAEWWPTRNDQSIESPLTDQTKAEGCLLCGLAPVTRNHIALPADMMPGFVPSISDRATGECPDHG